MATVAIQGHRELVQKYAANFDEHLAHAEPYEALAKGEDEAPESATGGKTAEKTEPAQRKPVARRSRKAA